MSIERHVGEKHTPSYYMGNEAKRDAHLVRRKLGIGHDDPLPRCPCRAASKLKEFERLGDYSHSGPNHICSECGCTNAAGMATDHLGYGYCKMHEKQQRKKLSGGQVDRINQTHKAAIIKREPGVYATVGKFAEMVKREGVESAERITLLDEIQLARGQVQELILLAKGEMLSDEVDEETGERIPERLTEYQSGRLVEASTITRMGMLNKMLPNIAKIAKVESDLRNQTSVSEDQFRLWFGKLWSAVESFCMELDDGDHDITGELIKEHFMLAIKRVGDPRSGK